MNRRLFLQATAPAVVIGVLLLAACLISAWHINRLQTNMTAIRLHHVASLQAAQELEISLHSLHFQCYLHMINPRPTQLDNIRAAEQDFEDCLGRARKAASTEEELACVQAIEKGYLGYRDKFNAEQARLEVHEPRRDFAKLADDHPIREVVEPCRRLYEVNERMMIETSQESARLSDKLRWVLMFLGFGGPVSGIIMGYGIARGVSRSLSRLRVRVQDMAQRLDNDVLSVSVAAEGDLRGFDHQLEQIVHRMEEVAARVQQQQRDILRAQQLAAVGQLAASVAHEVRNPLTAIKLLVEAALRTTKPRPCTPENLRVIHGEVVRLEQTVQGFLDFARPPALQPAPCDVPDVVAQAIDLVRARARQQKVELIARCPETPAISKIDRGQFCTVLVNLFLNALDAMPAGGRLEVSLRQGPRRGGLVLRVTDTGKGIAPEVAEQLFVPFTSTKPTGTGLGLSISRRIVEEHGGVITGANDPQGGAVFTITLPAHAGTEKYALVAGHR